MSGLLVLLSVIITVVSPAPPDGETLKFLVKDWSLPNFPGFRFLKKHKGEKMIFNCTTNDPDAEVSLLKKVNGKFQKVETSTGSRFVKENQTFTIEVLQLLDIGEYQCEASNQQNGEILKTLGQLSIDKIAVDEKPEIFPYVDDKLMVEKNGKALLECKTLGYSGTSRKIIEWYLRMANGTSRKLEGTHLDQGPTHTTIDVVTYEFTNFQETDAGTYVCVRTVNDYKTESKIIVEMKALAAPKVSLPHFTSRNPVKTINVSQILSLFCSASGSPSPKVYWLKDNKHVWNCSLEECLFALQSADHPRDSGVYSCVAENYLNTSKKDVTVVVQVPIKINKPSYLYPATYEEDKTLSCEVLQGNPPPTIRWDYQVDDCESSNDCVPLDDKWKPVEKQSPNDDTPTMKSSTISVKSKTNIFYRCTAQNVISKDVYNFKLIRRPEGQDVFDFETNSSTVNEKEPLKIVCSIGVRYKSAVIKKVGSTNTLETSTKIDGEKTTLTYLKSVSNLSDEGDYQCQATRARGGSLVNKTLSIVVKKLLPPEIHSMVNKTVNQDNTSELRMLCNVSGNPHPTVKWKHRGIPLNFEEKNTINSCSNMVAGIYRKAGRNDTLIICNLNFEKHSGYYECSAKNKIGSVSKSMYLSIEASPKFLQDIENDIRTFGLNDPVAIKCEATANPPANVTWEKVDSNETTVVVAGQLNINILSFDEATEEHTGLYRCTAENKFGTNSRTVELSIKGTSIAVTSSKDSKATIIGIIIAFVALIIIIFIVVFIYQRRLKKKYALYLEPNESFQLDKDRTLFEQSSELPYDMAWEYPRERLTFVKTLGSGAFGQVWLAEAEGIHGFKPRDSSIDARKRRKSIQKSRRYHSMSFRYKKTTQAVEVSLEKSIVAVKTLKDGAAEGEYKDLASELKILIHLGEHKNIVNLLGACTTGGNLCVILECCPHGSLLNFLRSRRDTFEPVWKKHQTDMEKEFTYIDLLLIAYQVGKGMDFLQSKKCVHRDLAARNVLVGDDYVMKIADFGLARDIYKDELYLKQTTGLLPVKWMAPESLFDKVYTSSSDVWSFGILLWEIFTLGGSPYPGLPTEDLFSFLEDGKRMDCPERCPKDVYEIMYDCWTKSPYSRPLFAQLVERLNNVMKQNVSEGLNGNEYLDFSDGQAVQDSYLTPEDGNNKLKRGVSSEYLEATAPDTTHPKGDSHVPLLTEVIDDDDDITNSPLPLPPGDEHYKVPVSIRQPPF